MIHPSGRTPAEKIKWAQDRESARYRFQTSDGKTSNAAETEVAAALEADGWEVHKNGWPDFLAFKDGRLRFIEVKAVKGMELSARQARVAQLLNEVLYMTVELVHGEDDLKRR